MFEVNMITRSVTGVQGVHNGVTNEKRAANFEIYNPLIICVEHIGIEPMTS